MTPVSSTSMWHPANRWWRQVSRHPEPPLLARLRRAVLDDPDGFLAIAGGLAAAGCPLSSDERLSRPPRGFEAAKGTPVADYVGWKSFTAHHAEQRRNAVPRPGRPHR